MQDFNRNWKFRLNTKQLKPKMSEDIYGQLISLDETEFKTVDLPHDFSIEQPYSETEGDAATGYLVGGIGWYRKHFSLDGNYRDKKIFVCFDGIYNRSNIYINEKFVKFQPFGYVPVLIDISDYVKEENVLSVKVDHSRYQNSRWYPGGGIYRKVQLHIFEKMYIPVFGTRINTAAVSEESAVVTISTQLKNESTPQNVTIVQEIIDPTGKIVAINSKGFYLNESKEVTQKITITNPLLWDIYQGQLYTAVTELVVDGKSIQTTATKFGIRDFEFTVDKGFFINGRHEYIKGVCLHHDAGAVGAAVPKDVWRRRFEILIAAGVNAIRTAHNPASREFIELCDEMGLLVQEEFFDEWDNPKDKKHNAGEKSVSYITMGNTEYFRDYAKDDLQNIIRRDYNSPSIVQWSIGNEIEWTYPKYNAATGYFGADAAGGYFFTEPPYSIDEIRRRMAEIPREQYEIADTAKKLADWTKELDTTRPVIANCILPSASYESGYTDALDMVGFSYRRVMYDRCHRCYPDKPIMGTENVCQWHEWKAVLDNEYIAGIFLWTGIEYMGEAGKRGPWPLKSNIAGLIDVAGFPKGSYHMFKTLWQDKPYTHMMTQVLEKSLHDIEDGKVVDRKVIPPNNPKAKPQINVWDRRLWVWQDVNDHYNYSEGDMILVEVYSNCDEVTLYQNGEKISTLYLKDFEDRIYRWCVPYKPGELTAQSDAGTTKLVTTGKPASVKISCDKNNINTSVDSAVNIIAQLYDEAGNAITAEDAEIEFIYSENAVLLGVDNGSRYFVGDHKCPKIMTNNGHALLILAAKEEGSITVEAKLKETISNKLEISITEYSIAE